MLVILDNPVIKETHSLFLAQLAATGAATDIKIAEDHTIALKERWQKYYRIFIQLHYQVTILIQIRLFEKS